MNGHGFMKTSSPKLTVPQVSEQPSGAASSTASRRSNGSVTAPPVDSCTIRSVDSRRACTVSFSRDRSSVGWALESLMCTWIIAAPASRHSLAVVTSSPRVTGSGGTADFSSSAPVGATVIIVAGPGLAAGRLLLSTVIGGECLLVRAVVQRASQASGLGAGTVVGELAAPGLVVLVGVTHDDTERTVATLASKVYHLRILDGEKSCADTGAPLLVVSQFTLYAQTAKGRRPTWQAAAPREGAEPLVTAFADALRSLGASVQTGVFGADMAVALVNDGPVTLILQA